MTNTDQYVYAHIFTAFCIIPALFSLFALEAWAKRAGGNLAQTFLAYAFILACGAAICAVSVTAPW